MRFTVHAHREVTPGRWFRAFIGGFEGLPTRDSVQGLLAFAKQASDCEPIALHGRSETLRQVQALYVGAPNPPTIPFVIVNEMMRDELCAIVNDPHLSVPDSVLHQWNALDTFKRMPTVRAGEIPT